MAGFFQLLLVVPGVQLVAKQHCRGSTAAHTFKYVSRLMSPIMVQASCTMASQWVWLCTILVLQGFFQTLATAIAKK